MLAVSAAEETYLGFLVMMAIWAVFSRACLVATAHARQRSASWFWVSSFLVASLVAAYCFGKLL
jgi:hypothetical protein